MKRNRKYAVMIDGADIFNASMTPALAKKLRERSRVRVSTCSKREGVK
jgi:hypothetical protein